MGLEAATYVNDLNVANPIGASDPKSQGDDHLRLIKQVLKNTFPNMIGPLTTQLVDAGATQGPTWILDRNSASPAVSDLIGGLIFRGRNSAAATVDYTNIVGRITDPVAGTEDSQIGLQVRVGGALTEILTIDGAGIAGVGSGLTALNGSNITLGTVADARIASTLTGKTLTGAALNGTLGATTPSTVAATTISSSGAATLNSLTVTNAATVGTTLGVTGIITGSNNIVANQNFASSTTVAVVGTTGAGNVNLRPNGVGSTIGQMTVASNGNVTVAGDLTANSDLELKRDIEELETSKAIDAILHIPAVKYTRRVGGEQGIGFIAQDVEQYYPELVKHDDAGLRSLAYPNMNAILWSAVRYLLQKELAA